jgi:uncharacterized iron-regulated membrane protein
MTVESISVADRPAGGRLYAMLWRWHFLAALIVIPFVLWQSTTGSLYLWSEWWIDQRFPELRFVAPAAERVPLSAQVAAALATAPKSFEARTAASGHSHGAKPADPASDTMTAHDGPPVQEIIVPSDPRRSTIAVLRDEAGLAYAVFVDPRDARVLGSLTGTEWLPGITRALHGGWPLGKPGSWLLELGDGWAIFMIASGLYLWWPRGRTFLASLWPRFDRGPRILMRDLHASVAVLFSVVFLFFLISALPWTAFWGGEVLSRLQTVLGQNSPAGFSPGGASVAQMTTVLRPIDEIAAEARTRDVAGTLVIRLAPWPGAPLYLMNKDNPPADDRVLLADPKTGKVAGDFTRSELPVIPRLVGFGIHLHQGDFGPWNLWLNTAFALSLVWLTVTGIASWWIRAPKRGWGVPPKVAMDWPRPLIAIAAILCVLLPIFGASVVLVATIERLLRGRWRPA